MIVQLYHTVNGHLRKQFPDPYRRSSKREGGVCTFQVDNHIADFRSEYNLDGEKMLLASRESLSCRSMDMKIHAYLLKACSLINEDPSFVAEVVAPGNILKVVPEHKH